MKRAFIFIFTLMSIYTSAQDSLLTLEGLEKEPVYIFQSEKVEKIYQSHRVLRGFGIFNLNPNNRFSDSLNDFFSKPAPKEVKRITIIIDNISPTDFVSSYKDRERIKQTNYVDSVINLKINTIVEKFPKVQELVIISHYPYYPEAISKLKNLQVLAFRDFEEGYHTIPLHIKLPVSYGNLKNLKVLETNSQFIIIPKEVYSNSKVEKYVVHSPFFIPHEILYFPKIKKIEVVNYRDAFMEFYPFVNLLYGHPNKPSIEMKFPHIEQNDSTPIQAYKYSWRYIEHGYTLSGAHGEPYFSPDEIWKKFNTDEGNMIEIKYKDRKQKDIVILDSMRRINKVELHQRITHRKDKFTLREERTYSNGIPTGIWKLFYDFPSYIEDYYSIVFDSYENGNITFSFYNGVFTYKNWILDTTARRN